MANKEFSSVQAESKSVVIYCRDDYARQKVKELEDTYKAAISDKVVPCQSLPQQPITGKEKWVYRVAGTTSFSDYMWDADATPAGWILMSTSNHGIDEEPTPGSTNLAESGGIFAWGNRTFTKPFGFYDGMTVGTSRNLLGKATVTETFWKKILGTGIAKGLGYVDKVQGESIAWAQFYKNVWFPTSIESGITYTVVDSYTWNISGTATAQNTKSIYNAGSVNIGHKYYISIGQKIEGLRFGNAANVSDFGVKSWVFVAVYGNLQLRHSADAVITNKTIKPILLDLTLLGIDNLTTADEVEAWLAAHPGEADYYAYDAGSLLSVKMQNVKTVGFNRWDEQWEEGDLYPTSGSPIPSSSRIRSKNFCPISPNTAVYGKNGGSGYLRIFYYRADKTFIAYDYLTNTTKTTPADCYFFKIASENYGSVYNHNFCINFSNSALNGTYMPYQTDTRPLDVTNITGINPTTGTREKCFPNGMRSAGTAHDEIVVEGGAVKARKKLESLNLGSKNYQYDNHGFYFTLSDSSAPSSSSVLGNILCAPYKTVALNNYAESNKSISLSASKILMITDNDYTDPATFKTAMSGVLLFYELAEPVVYTDLQDADGNPIFMPFGIPVEPLGTLEVLPENEEGEALTMCAPTLTLRMSIDAVHLLTDEVPATYQTYAIDKQNMNALVAAINQYLGATMGGTFSVVENADKSLSITFTAASNNQNE